MLAEVQAFEEPIVNNLVKEGKLTEKQKDEILNEHEKNLQNLQKQQEIGKYRNNTGVSLGANTYYIKCQKKKCNEIYFYITDG